MSSSFWPFNTGLKIDIPLPPELRDFLHQAADAIYWNGVKDGSLLTACVLVILYLFSRADATLGVKITGIGVVITVLFGWAQYTAHQRQAQNQPTPIMPSPIQPQPQPKPRRPFWPFGEPVAPDKNSQVESTP